MGGDVAICAEGVSKRYVLGGRADKAGGLRHAIEHAVTSPFRWAGRSLRGGGGGGRRTVGETFWALRDLGFEVRRGEVMGLIGRNGAGKSTLLKILSRITEPTTGRIGINGRIASLLEVGTGFHPELTGRENVFLNGAILGMTQTEVRRKFDEIVAFAGIEKFLDTPVKRYSSGMYVRLAFAVAAHLEPEILVVDEVLAVGDAQFQQKCLGKMREVSSQSGRTVIFVSHAMHSVKALCTSGMLLSGGRIVCRGPVDRVLAAYSQSVSNGSGVVASNLAEGISLLGARVGSLADDGSLRIEATFRLEKEIRHAGLGIHIETMSGFELCDLRPETSGLVFGDRRGDFGVSFLLTDLCRHLAAGTYRLGLSFHETNWRRCLDRTPVGEFIVPSTDIYGTGFPPKQEKDGPLVVPVSDVHVG
jgi:lipopolysaccharide transport system ATP-binding protein